MAMAAIDGNRLFRRIPPEKYDPLCALTLEEFSRREDLVFHLWDSGPPPGGLGIWVAPTARVRWQVIGSLKLNFGHVWLPQELATLAGEGMWEVTLNKMFSGWWAVLYRRVRRTSWPK